LSQAAEKFEILLGFRTMERLNWPVWSSQLNYYLGRTYEDSRWTDQAIEQYELFLAMWSDADISHALVIDAQERIDRLRSMQVGS
jgi:hypothetical protein